MCGIIVLEPDSRCSSSSSYRLPRQPCPAASATARNDGGIVAGGEHVMRYRVLGPSGIQVGELALGTMTFGTAWEWGADKAECGRMLEAFVEAGGNFVDTGCNYTDGESETIVGELLDGRRDRFVVATKYTLTLDRSDPNAGGNHSKRLRRAVEQSLRRLRTDYIDLLWLHMWDRTAAIENVMYALDVQVRAGKVLEVGFSDTPAWVVAEA